MNKNYVQLIVNIKTYTLKMNKCRKKNLTVFLILSESQIIHCLIPQFRKNIFEIP